MANTIIVAIIMAVAWWIGAHLACRALRVLIRTAILRTIQPGETQVAHAGSVDTLTTVGAVVWAWNQCRTHHPSVSKVTCASLVLASAMVGAVCDAIVNVTAIWAIVSLLANTQLINTLAMHALVCTTNLN